MAISSIEEVLQDIREGKMVIIVDDEDRENEGDVMIASEKASPEAITFMARYACGLICLSLTEERVKQLDLPLMVQDNTSPYNTAFTVSIEAKEGITTGISAFDRAKTVKVAIDPKATADDITRPGHIFPLPPVTAVSSYGSAIQRHPSISHGLRAFTRQASYARS